MSAPELDFDEMLQSFVGLEIEEVDVNADTQEVLLVMNDGSAMVVGANERAYLYIKRLQPSSINH